MIRASSSSWKVRISAKKTSRAKPSFWMSSSSVFIEMRLEPERLPALSAVEVVGVCVRGEVLLRVHRVGGPLATELTCVWLPALVRHRDVLAQRALVGERLVARGALPWFLSDQCSGGVGGWPPATRPPWVVGGREDSLKCIKQVARFNNLFLKFLCTG